MPCFRHPTWPIFWKSVFFIFRPKKSPKMYLKIKISHFSKILCNSIIFWSCMPIFSQIPPKTKEWHPLKYPGTGPFLRVFAGKNFPAVGRQPCSQVIYLKIWENLLIYYLGKVKKFEKHRMIGSIFKNVISVGGAYMPGLKKFPFLRYFRSSYTFQISWLFLNSIWEDFPKFWGKSLDYKAVRQLPKNSYRRKWSSHWIFEGVSFLCFWRDLAENWHARPEYDTVTY